jgi:hypothetical protein
MVGCGDSPDGRAVSTLWTTSARRWLEACQATRGSRRAFRYASVMVLRLAVFSALLVALLFGAAAHLEAADTGMLMRLAQRLEEDRPTPTTPAEKTGREHFQLKVTPGYEQGEYGANEITRIFALPFTFRYLAETWDLSATFSYLRVDSPGEVTFVAGQPVRVEGAAGQRRVDEGFGDIVLKGRYYLIEDTGTPGSFPSITPVLRLKIPTARSPELGTGEPDFGFGIEFDKTFDRSWIVFGDVTYTIIGEPEGQDFRNRPGASLGVGYRLSNVLTVTGLIDWRRAIVERQSDPVDLIGFLSVKVTPTFTVTPYLGVGLTNGSSDFGIGVEFSYKFGRY